MRFITSYFLLPTIFGLALGLGIVLSKPELRYAMGQQVATFFLPKAYRPVSYALAVSKAAPAVVNISTRKRINQSRHPLFDDPLFRYYFNSADVPKQQRMSNALGSGVIVNQQGYILTNYHVVADAEVIDVGLYDGRRLTATLVGTDAQTDLAVLKIPANSIQAITLGEPQQALIGDVVLAIGNPFNVGQTVTQGIISATGRHGIGLTSYENFIQTDAAINPGNSGGALIDAQGNLLGINTAIIKQDTASNTLKGTGISFAIPADFAVKIMNDIITNGEAIRGWLGIEALTLSPDIIRNYNLENARGVLITNVYDGGPADQAGLKKGDVLTHINDKSINNGREGMNLIAEVQPNDKVQITVLRNGEKLLLTAIAAKRPQELQ